MAERGKIFFDFRIWRNTGLRQDDGIIVGTDKEQEWLLPWWWENYRRFNAYPVAFVDYGMSQAMRGWCRRRGELIDLSSPDLIPSGNALLHLIFFEKEVDSLDESFWQYRSAWLKKPLACLQSPFQRTVWIDLDCEVRGSIHELFERYGNPLSLAKDAYYPVYNSGVIVFKHGIEIVEEWARMAIDFNYPFLGDQDILSWLIEKKQLSVEMPRIYNWSLLLETNPEAVILHWHGPEGKEHIQKELML
jgi:hypothetical protein